MLYAACFTVSIILLKIYEVRPITYYLVISLMATIILIEILSTDISDKKAAIIVLQIMLLSLNLLWGVTLKYYYYTGFTDVFGHVGLAENLLANGFITDVFDIYQPFALWHILAVAFSTFSGLPLRMDKVLNVLCGIVFFFMPAAIYLLSNKLLGKRTALLAALIAFFYPTLITYGMYSIPRSVESLFFVLLLILLFDGANKVKYYLALFMVFIIIVYHTASINYIFMILLLVFVLQKLLPKKDDEKPLVTFEFLLITAVMTFLYWSLFANALINTLLADLFSAAPSGPLTKSIYVAPITEVFNYLQYMPTIFFIIIGVLLVLGYNKYSDRMKLMGIVALVLTPASFPGPLLLINKLAGNLNFGRFEEYTFLFIGLIAAIGFGYLYFRSAKLFKVCLVLLFAVWVFLSVSNDFVALDNPLVKRPFYTFYLAEEEVDSINRIDNTTIGNVVSDYVTIRYLNSTKFDRNVTMMRIDDNATQIMRRRTIDNIVIRDGELNTRPLQFLTTDSRGYTNLGEYYYKGDEAYNLMLNYSRIYDSNSVKAFGNVHK